MICDTLNKLEMTMFYLHYWLDPQFRHLENRQPDHGWAVILIKYHKNTHLGI